MSVTIESIQTARYLSEPLLSERYWAHTLDKNGLPVFTYKTTTLTAEHKVNQPGLLSMVKATVVLKGPCSVCKEPVTVTLTDTSRASLVAGMKMHPYYEYFWDTHPWMCDTCRLNAQAKQAEYQAESEAQAEEVKKRTQEKREQRKGKLVAKYGNRYIGDCPKCDSGSTVLRINGTTLELFIGCSGYSTGCQFMRSVPAEDVKEARERFMADLTKAWETNVQAAAA